MAHFRGQVNANRSTALDMLAAKIQTEIAKRNDLSGVVSEHGLRTDNPHAVTAEQVGLGNADNTADLEKPISTDAQEALDGKAPLAAAVPVGGTTGQVLAKASNDDHDTEWATPGNPGLSASQEFHYFGDGADGDLNINSGTTTLTRDMFYRDVTISGTAVLACGGFRIYVSGTLDLTNAPAGAILAGANDGGNGGVTGSAGAGGSALAGNTVPGTGNGSAGGAGGTGTGGQASAAGGSGLVNGSYGTTETGGKGGNGASGNGGAARQITAATSFFRTTWPPQFSQRIAGTTITQAIAGVGAPGGGGGGGDGTAGGGGGGGGGGSRGIFIAAATLSRGASTAASAIKAVGGLGGNGGTPAAGNRGGGGGGMGGGGGVIWAIIGALSGTAVTGLFDASGGNGGNGGNGSGTGTAGDGGYGGPGGMIAVTVQGQAAQFASYAVGGANTGQTGGPGGAVTLTL